MPARVIEGEDVLEVLRKRDQMIYTAGDVADELDVAKKTALDRLKELEAENDVRREELGRAIAWFLPDEHPPQAPPESESESQPEPEAITDGGLSRGGSIVRDLANLSGPRTEQEANAIDRVANDLGWAGAAAITAVIAAVVHTLFVSFPEFVQIAFGFVILITVALVMSAAARLILLFAGWYAPARTGEFDTQRSGA